MIHHIATVIILNITSHGIVHNVEARNPCTIIYGCLSHVLNGDLNKRLNAFREFRNVVRPYDEVAAQLLLGSIFSDRGLISRETGSGYSGNSRYEYPSKRRIFKPVLLLVVGIGAMAYGLWLCMFTSRTYGLRAGLLEICLILLGFIGEAYGWFSFLLVLHDILLR